MMADNNQDQLHDKLRAAPERRLDALLGQEKTHGHGKNYTRFVRALRLFLPLLAVGIVGLVLSWPQIEERMSPPVTPIPQDELPQTGGRNELINPRFESEDDKSRPYTVTAARAVQSAQDPDIIALEKPMGDINLSDGSWIAAEAQGGEYNQRAQTLQLSGSVKLFHDDGYELLTERLRVDMAQEKAWSDAAVLAQGPAGRLNATGLQADMAGGTLIFTGPLTLVLNRKIEGL